MRLTAVGFEFEVLRNKDKHNRNGGAFVVCSQQGVPMGVSKQNPLDEFDLLVGCKIALIRALEVDNPGIKRNAKLRAVEELEEALGSEL